VVIMRNALRLALLPGLLSAAACGGSYAGFPQGVGGGSGGTPVSWSQLAAGMEQTCGVSTSGVAYCWGTNDFGEIGDGTTIAVRYTPKVVTGGLVFQRVTAGQHHSCGIVAASAAYCWGANADAQLGDGTTTNRSAPAAVAGGLTFAQLSAGAVFTCGVAASGSAYCWGDNSVGELGVGDLTRRGQPTLVGSFMALTFASVSAGDWTTYHACGITPASVTYCWGDNASGELGTGDSTGHTLPVAVTGGLSFTAVAVGGPHTCAIAGGTAYCWGGNASGELGTGDSTARPRPTVVTGSLTFSSLSAGGLHTCGLVSGVAYCWGRNAFGQLGVGDTLDRATPTPVAGDLAFSSLSAGYEHTCGVTTAGAAYCWGRNLEGQLGDNTTSNRSQPVAVQNP
jgi:alpha-tubulin suppressor-like RCC1 family protein